MYAIRSYYETRAIPIPGEVSYAILRRRLGINGFSTQNDIGCFWMTNSSDHNNSFISLAVQRLADAQNSIGMKYDSGQGVPQDYAEAIKWYSYNFV